MKTQRPDWRALLRVPRLVSGRTRAVLPLRTLSSHPLLIVNEDCRASRVSQNLNLECSAGVPQGTHKNALMVGALNLWISPHEVKGALDVSNG